jgi:cytochrome c1
LDVAAGCAVVVIAWRHLQHEKPPTGCNGSPARGRALVVAYGCASCHEIPGAAPLGLVGPSLDHIATRAYIAGKFTNEPIELQAWIRDPPRMKPGTAMPNLGVTDRDARDITAYLRTLK